MNALHAAAHGQGPARAEGRKKTMGDSQAEESKYDPDPLEAPDDDDDSSGDDDFEHKGEDLSSGVPDVDVVWQGPPSWEIGPQGGGSGGGDSDDDDAEVRHFSMDATSVRAAEENMLTESRSIVATYTQMKEKVAAEKGTVFGQGLKYWDQPGHSYAGGTPQADPTLMSSEFAGDDFAEVMNPIQEQVLAEIGGLLQTTGGFIAMINRTGQAYAQADRESKFPEPPADI